MKPLLFSVAAIMAAGSAIAAPSLQCRQAMTQLDMRQSAFEAAQIEVQASQAAYSSASALKDGGGINLQVSQSRFERAATESLGAITALVGTYRWIGSACNSKAATESAEKMQAEAAKMQAAFDRYVAGKKPAAEAPKP